ncbi:MAG: sulfite exporter TauE/SafE family protein [Candidatus Sericytochromatia bacterium]
MSLTFILLSLGSGLAAGVLSGLFGVGGGTLVVPMLMVQGAGIHQAVPLSLVYILFTSLSGSLIYWRQGLLEVRTVVLMSLSAILTIYAGVNLNQSFSQSQLAWLFAAFMALILSMFAWKERQKLAEVRPVATGRKRWLYVIFTGLLAGLIASLLGVGGGLIMVPLLILLCGEDLRQATGTSLAAVFLIAIIGLVQHTLFGQLASALGHFGINLLLMSAAGMAGAPLGVWLNRKLPDKLLRLGFISLCLTVMGYMIWKANG